MKFVNVPRTDEEIEANVEMPSSTIAAVLSAKITLTAGTLRAWAQDVIASAPPRTELDFALHFQRQLDLFLARVE